MANPQDLSIEELEKLLAEKRQQAAQKRFNVRLEPKLNVLERGAQKMNEVATQHKPRVNFSRVTNRVLLLMEIVALLGLAAVLIAGYLGLRTLNQESAQLQSPTNRAVANAPAQAVAVQTLPASSQPPSAVTPERFQSTLQQVVPVALPTPGPQAPVRVVIPAIKVDSIVVQGDDWEALKKGVGHHIGSANPGQRGNLVLSGHDDIFGEVFRYLEKLNPGDEVHVYTQASKFTYVVRGKRIVEPTEVSVIAPTTEPTLTMITCHPYLVDTHRMVVFAQLVR